VLTGPDVLHQPAWRFELPASRCCKLSEYRVAVWAGSPLSEIDASVRERFSAAVDENARLDMGDAETIGCS